MSFTNKLGSHHAWVWASDPSRTDEYIPDSRWQANSTGLPNRVQRWETGYYTVTIPIDDPGTAGHAQITAYGTGPGTCSNNDVWPGQDDYTVTVGVSCVSADQQPYDSAFTVTFVRDGNVIGQPTLTSMYLWATSWSDSSDYTRPDSRHWFYADGGGTITQTRIWPGQYAITSPIDAYLTKGNVLVTSGWRNTTCSVVSWNFWAGIRVNCYLLTGAPHDSAFYLSFVGPRT
jgi:hypothetical protein